MRPATRRLLRRWFWFGTIGFVVFGALCNRWVINSTDAYLYRDWSLMPETPVGLVLGTSPYARSGKPSGEFQGRILAAAQLYQIGKVKHLIVSGANPDSTYNEPRQMRRALIEQGVPATAITMDFAGFRTLDSVARAPVVFGVQRFTLITQRYHGYRAIFLGRKMGLDVIGYMAPTGPSGELGNRHPTREMFARIKAVLDIFFLKTQPRYLGDPEHIRLTPDAEDA